MVSDKERYLFDLNGYIVIKGALDDGQVERFNTLIDELGLDQPTNLSDWGHHQTFLERDQAFRDIVDNPRVLPYLEEWLGTAHTAVDEPQVRLDHTYFIFSDAGTPGAHLHLGNAPYVPHCSYNVKQGRIFSGLTVVSYVLSEVIPGQGGFACVPGSHKSEFPCPNDISELEDLSAVESPAVEVGDAVLFTEALTHGSLAWTAPHQRRAMFYKYSPTYMSWALPRWSAELLELCTPRQRKMLEPPYVRDVPDFFVPNKREGVPVS